MDRERWTAVDRYVAGTLVPGDAALDDALAASAAAGLPAHDVSPPQGRLLEVLARAVGARRVLEIGTLGGYSTIWLARAVGAGGRVVSLEIDPHRADVARGNLARAGLAEVVEVRVGPAHESLAALAAERPAPFDLVFVDADKARTADDVRAALSLARTGALVVADNVVRGGALADGEDLDPRVRGVRALHELLAAEPRVIATTIQTVGAKGYDGFTLALVVSPVSPTR